MHVHLGCPKLILAIGSHLLMSDSSKERDRSSSILYLCQHIIRRCPTTEPSWRSSCDLRFHRMRDALTVTVCILQLSQHDDWSMHLMLREETRSSIKIFNHFTGCSASCRCIKLVVSTANLRACKNDKQTMSLRMEKQHLVRPTLKGNHSSARKAYASPNEAL